MPIIPDVEGSQLREHQPASAWTAIRVREGATGRGSCEEGLVRTRHCWPYPERRPIWTRRKRAVKGWPFRLAFSGHGGPEKAAEATRRARRKAAAGGDP